MVLYIHATIVTVNPTRDVILDGAILVEDDRIADIGKASFLLEEHHHETTVDLTGRIIIPGLISTHMHTAQTLLRGKSHCQSRDKDIVMLTRENRGCG
jgi:cytosine/adenosine deaminase-related metal-dependent hydrolase